MIHLPVYRLFWGIPPGVGKTHLAIALGLRAIEQGSGVYFVRAHELLEDLRRAQAEHRLERRLRIYLAPKLLIIDEFGVWPYDRMAATAFFTLVSVRYERGSIILTSNKGFGEWGEVLGDAGTTPPPTTRRGWVNSKPATVGQKYAGVDRASHIGSLARRRSARPADEARAICLPSRACREL